MDFADLDTLADLVETTELKMEGGSEPAWLQQSDGQGRVRVLLAVACDLDLDGRRYRIFRVKLAAHPTSPIYYVFPRKGTGDQFATLAHYVLSHQHPSPWRKWVCDTTRNTTPFVGTYRGDLRLVGGRFHESCLA